MDINKSLDKLKECRLGIPFVVRLRWIELQLSGIRHGLPQ